MKMARGAQAHWIRIILVAAVLVVPDATELPGQTATGQVHGSVVDPVGAAVPNSDVMLTNLGTGIETSLNSDERGFFVFRNLQPGLYVIQVAAAGFKTAAVPEFPIEVNQAVTKAVTLEIGVVTETVEVVAGAEMVQQSSAELGEVISEAAGRDLPLNGQWMAVERLQDDTFQIFRFGDQVTGDPQNPGVTGASLASALLGLPSSFEGFLPDDGTSHFRVPTYSAYVQDEWRASPPRSSTTG